MSSPNIAFKSIDSSSSQDDDDFLARVGMRVRAARTNRGMSRKSLAQSSGVSERYLAQLESGHGNVSILLLRQIATAVKMPIEVLARSSPDAHPEAAAAAAWIESLSDAEAQRALRVLRREFPEVPVEERARIALIGLRGAGKTTLGRRLAEKRGLRFVELDAEVERAAGVPLAELFVLYGQASYRRHERRCLDALLAQDEPMVIATGGGIVTQAEAFDVLLSNCRVIWLKAKPEEHMARVIAQGDRRPMAGNTEAMDDLKQLLANREKLYGRAHVVIDTSGKTVAQAFRLLADAVPANRTSGR